MEKAANEASTFQSSMFGRDRHKNAAVAWSQAAEAWSQAGEKVFANKAWNNAADNFKKAGKKAMAELALTKTEEGQAALTAAKQALDNARNNLDTNPKFKQIPTTQHLKVLDYWGSSIKVDFSPMGVVGAAGHVFGFLLTLAFSPIWVPCVLIYNNLVSDSINPSNPDEKKLINPTNLDVWMDKTISSINSIKNLPTNNILKELNNLKDNINSQKSGWLVKRAIGDNSHYVKKECIDQKIDNIIKMIDELLPPADTTAATSAEQTITIEDNDLRHLYDRT